MSSRIKHGIPFTKQVLRNGPSGVVVVPGALLHACSPSSAVRVTLYADKDCRRATTNPAKADSDGNLMVYLDPDVAYELWVTTPEGVMIGASECHGARELVEAAAPEVQPVPFDLMAIPEFSKPASASVRYKFEPDFLRIEKAPSETLSDTDKRLLDEYGRYQVMKPLSDPKDEERERLLYSKFYKFRGAG